MNFQASTCANDSSLSNVQFLQGTAVAPTQGTCAANVTVAYDTLGRACPLDGSDKRCSGGSRCVEPVPAPYTACLAASGIVKMCPGSFPNKRVIGATFNNTVGCTPCTCGTSITCANATFRLYTGINCTGGATGASMDGSCNGIVKQGCNSYQYTADIQGPAACGITVPSTQNGQSALTNPQTVCCP